MITNISDKQFAAFIVSKQKALACSDAELARVLAVSRPTIGRWKNGTTAPHPLARQAVVTTLDDLLEYATTPPGGW